MLHLPFVTGSTSTHDDCTSSMREATTSRVEMYVERDMVEEVEAGRVSRSRSREQRAQGESQKREKTTTKAKSVRRKPRTRPIIRVGSVPGLGHHIASHSLKNYSPFFFLAVPFYHTQEWLWKYAHNQKPEPNGSNRYSDIS